jgi:hypothetical protein
MDYWEECITESFEEAGIAATKEQIDTVISWVEGAHENYGMASGYDCIPNPAIAESERTQRLHDKEIELLRHDIDCYRRSVAKRRGVNINEVYLDHGDVRYG